MLKLSEEKIKLIYEGEQLRLEEFLLNDLVRGGTRHVQGNFNCGVFCIIEMIDEHPFHAIRGVKVDLHFQGRQCDFEKFAGHLGFRLESYNFQVTPAPEYKPQSVCTLNKGRAPANRQVFKNKTPVYARLDCLEWLTGRGFWEWKTGHTWFIPITTHVAYNKPSTPLLHPVCGYYPERGQPYTFIELHQLTLSMTTNQMKCNISMIEHKIKAQKSPKTPASSPETPKKNEKPRKQKKLSSLRNAIRKTIADESPPKEEQAIKEDPVTCDQGPSSSNETDQRGKSTKHQGNAKTFKRKSKRPGRV